MNSLLLFLWCSALLLAATVVRCEKLTTNAYGEVNVFDMLEHEEPPSAEEWAQLKKELKAKMKASPAPVDPVDAIPVPSFVKLEARPRMDAELRQKLEDTRKRIAQERAQMEDRRARRMAAHRRRLEDSGPMSEFEQAMAEHEEQMAMFREEHAHYMDLHRQKMEELRETLERELPNRPDFDDWDEDSQ